MPAIPHKSFKFGIADSTTPLMRKKLIEVPLPLEALNRASAGEAAIRPKRPARLLFSV